MTPEAIKTFREQLDWSQQRLADELGVNQATVSRMENGVAPRGPVKNLLERMMAEHAALTSEQAA